VKRKANGWGRGARAGMTKVELVVVIGVIATFVVFAWSVHPGLNKRARVKAERIRCVNNLKHVGLAFRIFAAGNGDLFPAELMVSNGVELASIDAVKVYGSLRKELSTPKILSCPADKTRNAAETFTGFNRKEISYFTSLSARGAWPRTFLAGDRHLATNGTAIGTGSFGLTTNAALSWTKEIHPDHGNILMGDGSVHQMDNARLMQAVRAQEAATNWLVFP